MLDSLARSMEGMGLNTEVGRKRFGGSVAVEKVAESGANYLCKVRKGDCLYIVKGYAFAFKHINTLGHLAMDRVAEVLFKIAEIYQEYYLSKAASACNPHFAKALEIDQKIVLKGNTLTRLYIEVLYENFEEFLNVPLAHESIMRMLKDRKVSVLLESVKDELSAAKVKLANVIQETITNAEKTSKSVQIKKEDLNKIINALVEELGLLVNLAKTKKMPEDEVELEEDKEQPLVMCDACKKDQIKVSLACEHNMCKNCIEECVIDLAVKEKPYNHSIACSICNKVRSISTFR